MNGREKSDPEMLLRDAKAGRKEQLGPLLDLFRNYLRLIASSQIDARLRMKVNASDIVQDSFMEAFRDFEQFDGSSINELAGWLKVILNHNIAAQMEKQLSTQKRDIRRERSYSVPADGSGGSSFAPARQLVSPMSSPSAPAHRNEAAAILKDRLANLPEEYRQVLTLRHLDQLSFEEVALRMGRSPGAVRMLWLRALDRMRRTIDPEDFQ